MKAEYFISPSRQIVVGWLAEATTILFELVVLVSQMYMSVFSLCMGLSTVSKLKVKLKKAQR